MSKRAQDTVKSLMSRKVFGMPPSKRTIDALNLMIKNDIGSVPVVTKAGKLVGIVTERDLFKWVVAVAYEPEIPNEIKKLIKQNS